MVLLWIKLGNNSSRFIKEVVGEEASLDVGYVKVEVFLGDLVRDIGR